MPRWLALGLVLLSLAWPASAQGAGVYRTGFVHWRGLDGWTQDGADLIGPDVPTAFDVAEAIPSWNATTPDGGYVEPFLRARVGDRWTRWYAFGVWASGIDTVQRHSVRGEADDDASVAVDTLQIAASPVTALQMKVRLHGDASLQGAAIAYSTTPQAPGATSAGDPSLWDRRLELPACSQMVYRDGGRVWCSPTSTSMVLGYWLRDEGPCEGRVRAAVEGVYDATYRGHGNWPFNTAYAATQGMEAYVARFASLAQLEPWIAAGVPVVFSFAYGRGELWNSPLASVNGHLSVLVGFDADGNPLVHDPAASTDTAVPRLYRRDQLERLWLEHSGGTVYLIFPPGWQTPIQ